MYGSLRFWSLNIVSNFVLQYSNFKLNKANNLLAPFGGLPEAIRYEAVSRFLPVIASDQRERGNPLNFKALRDCAAAGGSSQ